MDYKDYYKIMGVTRDSTSNEIKRAYKKLARKYHPDVSKEADAETRFKEVGEAYSVLKDPDKRSAYDQLGSDWQSGQDFNPPPDWDAGFEYKGGGSPGASHADYSDFFESLFGKGFGSENSGGQYRTTNARGEDHHAKVLIDLEDAYNGVTSSITLKSSELDQQGRIVNKQRTLKIKIPKGVKQGQRLRLSGQGAPGFGGSPAGDLYLEMAFNSHSIYRVEQHDVYLDLPITPWEAALGATVKVPTPSGPVDLSIAPATKNGQKLRLKARGIPAKSPGDLYVVTQIILPAADTDEAKAFYLKMQEELAFNPRSELGV
ncbi:MAG: cytochrome C biogenesis protein [Gammaproteobacteria bacterium]|nr:MAG: cytochrome C biogenesis protein [Gammaproteobacteria bacterium]